MTIIYPANKRVPFTAVIAFTNFSSYKNIKVKELMLKDLPYINYYDSIENCIKFCGIITMKDILFEIENEEFQEVDEFELDSTFKIHMIL
jgi:predicted transcriptional regulator